MYINFCRILVNLPPRVSVRADNRLILALSRVASVTSLNVLSPRICEIGCWRCPLNVQDVFGSPSLIVWQPTTSRLGTLGRSSLWSCLSPSLVCMGLFLQARHGAAAHCPRIPGTQRPCTSFSVPVEQFCRHSVINVDLRTQFCNGVYH